MPKPTVWDQLALGGNEYMMTRKLAMEKAKPLDEHVTECLKFLRRIDHVEVTEAPSSKDIVINIYENDEAAKGQVWFTITREREEFRKLHTVLRRWADCHINLDMYEIPACGYCKPLLKDKVMWPGSIESVFSSTSKKMQVYTTCLNAYITCGRGEVDHDRVCFGVEHIPSVLARFLLTGVDQTKL